MSRGSFGRSVARAAASGGSKSYRARPPILWYLSLAAIVIAGVGLIVYSRNERISAATIGPTATDDWQVAYSIDICGTIEPNLPANSNLSEVGIRTFGNGLINIDPGAVSTGASSYEGSNATLGKFASSYPNFALTDSTISIPSTATTSASTTTTTSTPATSTTTAKKSTAGSTTTSTTSTTTTTTTIPPTVYATGESCTKKAGPLTGKGVLEAEVYSSATASPALVTSKITSLHLSNGEMIAIAFVPAGAKVPVPASRSALLAALGTSSTSSGSSATTSTSSPKSGKTKKG